LFTTLAHSGEKISKRLEYLDMTLEFSSSNLQFVVVLIPMSPKRLQHHFSQFIDDDVTVSDYESDAFLDDEGDNGSLPRPAIDYRSTSEVP
jgi:hypothetical protein